MRATATSARPPLANLKWTAAAWIGGDETKGRHCHSHWSLLRPAKVQQELSQYFVDSAFDGSGNPTNLVENQRVQHDTSETRELICDARGCMLFKPLERTLVLLDEYHAALVRLDISLVVGILPVGAQVRKALFRNCQEYWT
jgi:hypothetical protein